MQCSVRTLPTTRRASQVVRLVLALAIVLLYYLLSDDGFGVNGPGGEVGENLGVDKGRSEVTIVSVVGPNGSEVQS